MRTKKILLIALVSVLLSSCVTSYVQVYKALPSNGLVVKNNLLVYEDKNCMVSYNLWDSGGNIGFQFYNKTDKNIYLNLEQSFFILNGMSHNYYKNRVFTNSRSLGTTNSHGVSNSKSVTNLNYLDFLQTNRVSASNTFGVMTSSGASVSYNEEKIVCIPPMTFKIISEYKINESLFRNCDLYKYPTKNQIKPKTFSKKESPFVFGNRIAYAIGRPDNFIEFENEFYVAEISNYPESEIYESKFDEYCGQSSMIYNKYFKNVSADKFYIEYSKGQDSWRH
jgi:hypothetical protein